MNKALAKSKARHHRIISTSGRFCRMETGEVVHRFLGFRLLIPGNHDSTTDQERSHFRDDLKHRFTTALRRKLENARAIRVEPQLRDERKPFERLGRKF